MTAQPNPATRDKAHEVLLDVVVIGGSQAGLAMAWQLARQGLRFVVLEAGPEPGHTWRARWDSLKLFTPTQDDALPGMPLPGPRDTYPGKEQVADYLRAYAAALDLPVRLSVRVTELRRAGSNFEVHTTDEVLQARQVVVATGPFQTPFIPPAAQGLDRSATQLHSSAYRNPQALPDGRRWPGSARRADGSSARTGPPVDPAHPARSDAAHRARLAGRGAALRYQQVTDGRDAALAAALDDMVEAADEGSGTRMARRPRREKRPAGE